MITAGRRLISISLLLFALQIGCSEIQVGSDVQAGRSALQAGHPEDAVVYLSRAAESHPEYKFSNRAHESVLTHLGRAYYEAGDNVKARGVLERALKNDRNDSLARLYLGLTLYRANERDRGRQEIDAGLNGIHAWLDEASSDGVSGIYWDPNKSIRLAIERTLAGKPEAGEFTASAQRIGRQFDTELDRASQAESQSIYQQGGKN
jgi:tetratricopeptide (TPR) repeat protein